MNEVPKDKIINMYGLHFCSEIVKMIHIVKKMLDSRTMQVFFITVIDLRISTVEKHCVQSPNYYYFFIIIY